MDERLIAFIRALRGREVRVSMAESIDALRALEQIDVAERGAVQTALQSSLVKERADMAVFDELFPQFFGVDAPPPMQTPGGGLPDDGAAQLEQMLQELLDSLDDEALERLIKALMGNGMTRAELRDMMQQKDAMPDMSEGLPLSWAMRMAMDGIGMPIANEMLQIVLERLRQMGVDPAQMKQIERDLRENRATIAQQVAEMVQAEQGAGKADEDREVKRDELLDRPFDQFSFDDVPTFRREVSRLAARLRSSAALRMKRAQRGTPDIRRTVRANLRYQGIPLELRYIKKDLRPKLTVICDVSGSMRAAAAFMLLLVYALQDQVKRTRPFVYYRTIADVTKDFQELRPEAAIQILPDRIQGGPYQTSLGSCLTTFLKDHSGAVDRTTTVIFMGDGDDHRGVPRVEDFVALRKKAHKVLWFNPEPDWRWYREDNYMHIIKPQVDGVHVVSTLRELSVAIDGLFRV
ncbi:MAG: VWA domain-containing protein [Roseiflexaceae bacterium]